MDKELLEELRAIRQEIQASEIRMSQRMDESIQASETRMSQRMDESIQASEIRMSQRMDESIQASETRIKAYIESDVIKRLDLLTEGHQMLAEKLSRIDDMADDIEEIKGAMAATDAVLAREQSRIQRLEKMQG